MHSWKKFYETLLPEKEDFYSNITMEAFTYADYKHVKRKDIEIKNLDEYPELLEDMFENYRNKCIEINNLDPAQF